MAGESVGILVRDWRQRRRRSQLDVAIAADLSSRHLSFIETGRSTPSRRMIERLCEELEVPLRRRNELYLAAGYAPVHEERPLTELGSARSAVEAVLSGHEPYPAVAVNVHWEMLAANRPMTMFLADVPERLRRPRLNLLTATLHPDGLASRVRNYEQWHAHVVRRIRRQRERTAAPGLDDLLAEVEAYPIPAGADQVAPDLSPRDVAVPLLLTSEAGDLSFYYVLSVIGAPRDITLEEIAVESFFPADETTRTMLLALAQAQRPAENGAGISRPPVT
ncbi:MAG: helix-turn-helix domain-containing protein [Nocardioides sp.]|nr:helix-turn-helix domain-containing protein [Nocardioides sp.]